ncbi:malonic semialdehyde reductase [Craterilacuibacter sp.]|uniref:malonic semialdehyde reductase n=1 Tax=Craterilacuibacter sp. TaxID=2870909 RepID=UPI003F38E495
MSMPLSPAAIAQLFIQARTHSHWQPRTISPDLLQQLYTLTRLCPTSANASPARFVFITSPQAKAALAPHLAPGNQAKTMQAPVTVIVAYDIEFYEALPELYPHADAKSWFIGNEALITETAMRNSSLQGAYLIMAARALGLDCGPMSGFDQTGVNNTFFADGRWRANFLINLGYGVEAQLHPRAPRLDFDVACKIL